MAIFGGQVPTELKAMELLQGCTWAFKEKTAEITRLFEAETSCESYELLLQTQRDGEEQGEKDTV